MSSLSNTDYVHALNVLMREHERKSIVTNFNSEDRHTNRICIDYGETIPLPLIAIFLPENPDDKQTLLAYLNHTRYINIDGHENADYCFIFNHCATLILNNESTPEDWLQKNIK